MRERGSTPLKYDPNRYNYEYNYGNQQIKIGLSGGTHNGKPVIYNPVSDSTLKKQIKTFDDNVIEKIASLKVYSYYYKDDAQKEFGLQPDLQYGFLVQEVEKIFPYIVGLNSDGNKYISFHELIPLIVKGISEQQQEIYKLRIEIELQRKLINDILKVLESK